MWCYADPTNYAIIEFATAAAAKGFLRRLAKATGKQIEGDRYMKFSPNRTLIQRANDRRLGQIKHRLAQMEGICLNDVKIHWRKDEVQLKKKEVVYKKSKTGVPIYTGVALQIKELVEADVKQWLDDRGHEDSE